jgi:hypothetical protein
MFYVRAYNLILLLLPLLLVNSCNKNTVASDPTTDPIETEHFIFTLYDGLPGSITTPIINELNNNFDRILNDLNVQSVQKTKIEIWNDETHFQNDMKRDIGVNYPGSTGYIYNRTCLRMLNRGNIAHTAVHEFAHIVSLYVNGNFGNNPRWYWEAVAVYEAGDFINPQSLSYLVSGNFPTIAELNSDYNSGDRKIYQVGYLLSEYIIAEWGKIDYVNMIKQNANIESVLGITTQQFEAGWKNFVMTKYFSGG